MKQRIDNLDDFIFENTELNESGKFKKGEKVWRLMSRYNPQLGYYYVWDEITIDKITGKTIQCSDDNKYDAETGDRKNKTEAAYGSADYEIMSKEDAVKKNAELIANDATVRGLK
jgi:hypothetical protein